MLRVFTLAAALSAGPALSAEIETPTGQAVVLYDVILEKEMGIARFLFLAPGIAIEQDNGITYTDMSEVFPWLCETVILPALAQNTWEAAEVVISMADREVEFGTRDPEAVQFFEVFSVDAEDGCIWEGF
ncbi:DUF6497 family protein [Histidinibacterium aquaticum]|uniref:Acetolactate synthase n=1 Tax=Histidinibacterium aquaticum TaxID=2613962 RepID=A0A5J5GQ89_9RHOB|nr:DUF6497 family protein [Histidinibacterium aquaticum]KAA9009923.1 hypothetical protein F3S47_01245 [Histidinibacterium aquaticum]